MRVAKELEVKHSDPYILGTQEPDSIPCNPTQLWKDFGALCKMNKFDCTFHDLRQTFATMMIGNGCDVRTVASYLGHSSVSMTLNIYSDVDPEAKKASVAKVEESFDDIDVPGFFNIGEKHDAQSHTVQGIFFTVEQLEAMLEEAKRQ